ncbi:MAG: ABC transporter permease [Candidatus Omnitrophica bacterium]|nr:ABC transporter permease [Candidatus Omnitrophota bacterium]
MAKKNFKKTIINLKNLTLRNLRLKYASTFLGIVWAGLIPLILTSAIGFVFVKVLNSEKDNFHVFVLSGLLPWLYFSSVFMESTQSFIKDKSLMNQFDFPVVSYPLSTAMSNLIQHLIALAVLLPIFAFFNKILLFNFLALLIPVIITTVFLCGLSIISGILNLYIRDFEHVLSVFLMILFWLTPVFYAPEMVPDNLRFIVFLNPVTYFIEMYRALLLKGYALYFQKMALFSLAAAITTAALSWLVYRKTEGSILKKA